MLATMTEGLVKMFSNISVWCAAYPKGMLLVYHTLYTFNALVPDVGVVLPHSSMSGFCPMLTARCALQDSVPDNTLLVYHTAHLPQQVDKPNKWESDRYLYPHIAQMNAAGRHVAQMLHYHILDTEAMALQLPKESMMADITHPGAGFMMQVGPPCTAHFLLVILHGVCLQTTTYKAAMSQQCSACLHVCPVAAIGSYVLQGQAYSCS